MGGLLWLNLAAPGGFVRHQGSQVMLHYGWHGSRAGVAMAPTAVCALDKARPCSAQAGVPRNHHAARRPKVRTVRIHVLAHTSSPVDCASRGGLVHAELARYRGGSGRRDRGRSGPQLPQVRDPEVPRPQPAEWRSGRASRRARASPAPPEWRRWRSAACHRPDPDRDGLRTSLARARRSSSISKGQRARCGMTVRSIDRMGLT